MSYTGEFDFFYGMESERYHFLIVLKLLMKDMRFRHVSAEAKLMYGLLLDRNALSHKNGWLDEKNRVYIIYTIEEMRRDLGCATEKIRHVRKYQKAANERCLKSHRSVPAF
ncbi:MAG: replication initiator protein A [bacterium]|nr:replication initiator protein A [bacterium]